MGVYTELVLRCPIRDGHSEEARRAVGTLPRGRAVYMQKFSPAVYSIDGEDWSYVNIATSFKNYNDDIARLLGLLAPLVEHEWIGFCGYTLHEDDDHPTLIYYSGGTFRLFGLSSVVPDGVTDPDCREGGGGVIGADRCSCGGEITSDVYYVDDQEVQEDECSSCGLVYG